jgi:hypothetical protein
MSAFLEFIISILIVFIAFFGLWIVFQLSYGLELTPEQIADERKTQICIIYNISNEECFLVYGDINNDWEPEDKK